MRKKKKLLSSRKPKPDQMLVFKCGEMGHFQRDCQYDGNKPTDSQGQGQTVLDSYDLVVGK